MRWLLSILLMVILSCNTTPDNSLSTVELELDCGTMVNPYILSDLPDSMVYYKLDYWVFQPEDSTKNIDDQINLSVARLNLAFKPMYMQFELNNVYYISDSRKARNQKKYRQHAWEIDNWYWENRDSVDFALSVLVYPNNRKIFPGAAVNIPSTSFCIQERFIYGSTVVHEAAHSFAGLFHTHQSDATDGRNYTTGDLICDLAYHPPLYELVGENCDEIVEKYQDLSQAEETRLINNYMSYVLFKCRKSFSPEQIDRGRFISANTSDIRRARIN